MANYRGTSRNAMGLKSKEIFDIGSGRLSDSSIDLPGKLSILIKRGLGQKYITDPEKLDAPTLKKHQSFLDDQFAKLSYNQYIQTLNLDVDRRKSINDFRSMEYTPEISSALDIFADECTTLNQEGKILNIITDQERIQNVLTNLFEEILDIDHNLWYWIRSMCKFGDHFSVLDVRPGKGVVGFLDMDPLDIKREESYDGSINSVKFNWEEYDTQFAAWQVAHFRLTDDQKRLPYGTSALESSRMIWKQLTMAEDAMMIYRISRAPERRVFYIDVGNIDPADVPEYIQKIKNTIKRAPQVDQNTGNINQKYNTMAIDEDFIIPRRNEKNSEIDTLAGASNLDEIADIEYMQKKLFAALKVPKAFLTYDEDINAKATLSNEDARFARTINRIQQAAITTLTQIAITHLFALGLRDKDQLMSFSLELTNPSSQSELQKLEILSEKASTFDSLWDETTLSPVSWAWGMENIFEFSKEEMKKILEQQYLEGKMKLEIESVSQPEAPEMGEEEGGGGFTSGGQDLPDQPPEGYEYQDAETGETVSEMIDKLLAIKSAKREKKPLYSSHKLINSGRLNSQNPVNYIHEMEDLTVEKIDALKNKSDIPNFKRLND